MVNHHMGVRAAAHQQPVSPDLYGGLGQRDAQPMHMHLAHRSRTSALQVKVLS